VSDSDIHVLATFRSQEALLAGMRRAVSWIKVSEATAVTVLASEERLKEVLCPQWYSEREVELAIEVMHCYADLMLGKEPGLTAPEVQP
jgi:hypothetical protein